MGRGSVPPRGVGIGGWWVAGGKRILDGLVEVALAAVGLIAAAGLLTIQSVTGYGLVAFRILGHMGLPPRGLDAPRITGNSLAVGRAWRVNCADVLCGCAGDSAAFAFTANH